MYELPESTAASSNIKIVKGTVSHRTGKAVPEQVEICKMLIRGKSHNMSS
jgi:hypothetical protein